MKNLLAFVLYIITVNAISQTTIGLPFNPDADGNGFISVSDILNCLSVYDSQFASEEVTVNGLPLSDYVAESAMTIDSLSSAASVCTELQYLEAYEDYLTNCTDCYCTYNGLYSNYGWLIPNMCRHFTVYGWNSSSTTQSLSPIRLPESGLFPGQIIDIRLTDVCNWSGQLEIEALTNGSWSTIDNLSQDPCTSDQRAYLYSPQQNSRFVWDGSNWNAFDNQMIEINWSQLD